MSHQGCCAALAARAPGSLHSSQLPFIPGRRSPCHLWAALGRCGTQPCWKSRAGKAPEAPEHPHPAQHPVPPEQWHCGAQREFPLFPLLQGAAPSLGTAPTPPRAGGLSHQEAPQWRRRWWTPSRGSAPSQGVCTTPGGLHHPRAGDSVILRARRGSSGAALGEWLAALPRGLPLVPAGDPHCVLGASFRGGV